MQHPSTPTSAYQPLLQAADRDQYQRFSRSSISLTVIDSNDLSPRIKLSRSTTASELLAAFSPVQQPSKPPAFMLTGTMATVNGSRDLRQKERVSYTISDDSDSGTSPSVLSSSFPTPQKRLRRKTIVFEEDSVEELETARSPPPRISSAGHKLRSHRELHLSLRAQENGDKPVIKKRKLTLAWKAAHKKPKTILASDAKFVDGVSTALSIAPSRTARNEIRNFIATETATKRSTFFIAKKDYFLPLLPESNHISRLVEKSECLEADMGNDNGSTVPYETIYVAPKGVIATMKPYQLSGLSFLVYLHRNGLSGILGDEMGLGKTLQTLSLFQYLKEHRSPSDSDTELRPFLVVCPLSVLSSWISEARKWTPGLKVLRFHGPAHERNRLKRVASGEEDMHGNETKKARKKKQQRRTATGKPIISLDTDTEEEFTDERGVDLIVTTYDTFHAEHSWFKKAFVWRYVVLDEGHKIKNDLSQISMALQGLGAEYRLILTGTPLQNNLVELWALLHWLYPEVFTERSAELFRSSFDLTRGKVSTKVMDDARRLLELIMLRRMKNSPGVDLNLPPKTDVLLFVPLTPMQRFWYTRLLTRADKGLLEELFQGAKEKEQEVRLKEENGAKDWEQKDLAELEDLDKACGTAGDGWEESKEIMRQAIQQEQQDEAKKSAWRKLMNLLMQLRKCCNHPYLLPHAEPSPYYLGEHIIHASGKFIVLEKLINELVMKQGKKVLIFSGFTRMLDCCEDFLSLRGGDGESFKYVRLDGSTARARRNLGIRMFNDEKSEYKVMLISTRAGGLGINLATASDVIMLDQDWNPQIMLQAEARAHRIGQTKPVTVYKLCTQGTVEEQMMGRIQKKLYLSAKVTESMRDIHTPAGSKAKKKGRVSAAADEDMPQLDASQLMSLVRRGAQALSHPEINVNEMLGWDWATMLDNCKDKPVDVHVSQQTQPDAQLKVEDEQRWLSQMEQVESYVFGGKKYSREQDSGAFAQIQQLDKAERRVGKNTTVMVEGFAINKESMSCADWEAVPTMAGKDPRLAEVKREKRRAVVNQEQCQVCWDGGDLILCSGCPRSYHYQCLDKDFKARAKGKMQFHCPQHQCADCMQKTGDAGGMIFRCRWCERGYCEDCLDWDRAKLLGENLLEYELLDFPAVVQAFYIECPNCCDHHEEDAEAREFCANMALEFERKHYEMVEKQGMVMEDTKIALPPPSRAASLTDATTLDGSGVCTPQLAGFEDAALLKRGKREAAPESFKRTPTKRSSKLSA